MAHSFGLGTFHGQGACVSSSDRYRRTSSPKRFSVIVRSAPRFAVSLLVALSGDQKGVGVIRNLSINGCCISSGTVVKAGDSLNLEFHPGDHGPVIHIDLAEVRWATAWEFGVVFQSLLLEEQRRLLDFITTLPSA